MLQDKKLILRAVFDNRVKIQRTKIGVIRSIQKIY